VKDESVEGREMVASDGSGGTNRLFWHLDALEEGNSYNLTLPDGRKLGHRKLKVFYKQKFKKQDPLQVRINQKVARYRTYKHLDDLSQKLSLEAAQKKVHGILCKSASVAKGNSKAISSTFTFKQGHADNFANRSLVHHGYGGGGGGAHYTMASSKQFNKGVRVKGVISRHSKAGAKMQAARQAKRNKSMRGNGSMAVMQ